MAEQSADDILAELNAIQNAAEQDSASFERARSLVGHCDNDVRWQALIAIADWIETDPERVWEVVLEYGDSQDEDMRTGVATVLMEHVLEHYFDSYFQQLRDRIEAGDALLADTLSRCWAFGEARTRWDEVERLLDRD